MDQDLVKQSSELQKAEAPSLLDLALAENLELAMEIYKPEPQPGEVRMWQACLRGIRPETVNWAFREYFKVGTFPPKPADILGMIREGRENPNTEKLPEFIACGKDGCAAGWKNINPEGKDKRVKRCECYSSWRERVS